MGNTFRIKERITSPNLGNTSNVPVGSIIAWMSKHPPHGWLILDGQQLEKSKYPELYSVLGDEYGTPDDKSLFCLPDTRGLFLRGLDTEGKVDTNQRKLGSIQKDSIKSHDHIINTVHQTQVATYGDDNRILTGKLKGAVEQEKLAVSKNEEYISETRPVNIAVNWIIKV